MSLTSALSTAQSALFNTSRRTDIVSRNISEASNPDYARRSAALASSGDGARITGIRRATDDALFRQNLSALSQWSGQSVLSKGLDTLQVRVNGVDNAGSPAAALTALQEALQSYAATPSSQSAAQSVMEAARGVVRSLNEGTATVQSFRAELDREIATSVGELNRLLAEFEAANNEVVTGTRAGRDISDALDRRDALLKDISAYVPVSSVARGDNDMMLVTGDGVTLFETVARTVTFSPNSTYAPGMTGNAVYIDGVPLAAGSGGNTSAAGSLAANLQLRDTVAVQMQRQLDETARGLITAFAETDPSGTLADRAGLFTWPGGPALPAAATLVHGLAGNIALNTSFLADPDLLRDGGANGAGYVHNTEGGASYADLLNAYLGKLDAPMSFDPAGGLEATQSLNAFAAESIGWLESLRKDAARGAQTKEALATHTQTVLSDATGVNIDEEMSLLLDLENSYEASARLIATIDTMLSALMEATR
ncbi:flagellar hook-associated protein FlgK [Chelativorans intermedius]|uniref:Flagellar hook-associated protein 1 n=1 Tax=Chelativorans intermedius TaxID=515947 RepID=A0ABV6D8U2_9HYPH|nr:flagellar hook-associated protein FlgK [Chelativorans intermedius]MCT8997770.1 flagellar hook-associated protein FlgK [Chelativorans intermedius]